MSATVFRPSAFLAGGHAQTLAGQVVRTALGWPFPSEDHVVDAAEGARLLLRVTWQPEGQERPALVLVHGLEGHDRSPYLLSTGTLAYRLGWHVVRMNMRGCGDALALSPHLYNAGLSSDLVAVSLWLARRVSRFAVVGFSLGAGMTLLALSREREALPDGLAAAVAVCPPLDMSRSADALERRVNWIYQNRFVVSLKRSYRNRQRLSNGRLAPGLERGLRTLRQFDDVITAYYGGYRDAEHYYRTVSAGPRLAQIDRPTLVLSPANDPFITPPAPDERPLSETVRVEVPASGGHVGFVGPTRAPRHFWAGERAISFLSTTLDLDEV